MGLTETVTSLILVKSDSSQAKSDLKSFRGAEKQAAKERLAEIEATNKGIDSQIARWAKIGGVIAGFVGAVKLAHFAMKSYLEDVRLQSAAGSADIDRLRKSTMGLVETDNLLAFAGKAQAGMWRLNQQEMETVLKGATALRKTMGVELNPTIDKLTEAITKGSTRALKEFGIEAKDKQEALRELGRLYRGLNGDASLAGDGIEQASVKWKDAIDDLIGAFGELVAAMSPLLKMQASAMSGLASASTSSDWVWQAMGRGELGSKNQQLFRDRNDQIERQRALADAGAANQRLLAGGRVVADVFIDAFKEQAVKRVRGGGRVSGGGGIDGGDPIGAVMAAGGGASALGSAFGNVYGAGRNLQIANQNAAMSGAMTADAQARLASLDLVNQRIEWITAQMNAIEGPSVLERIFGNPEQISAMTVGIEAAQQAVHMFAQAGSAAMGAWIDGSKSMTAAVKEVLANSLKSVAMEATAKSLFHLAAAAGSFAFLSPAQAMMHLKAAGLYGSVAVVAGAGAKAAHSAGWAGGSGGGGAPAGTSAGGYVSNSNGHSGNGMSNTVIYVTNDAYRMSQAEREHRIADAARRGQQKRSRNVVAHE